MHQKKPYIIYEYPDKASFVKKDIELLSERYEVLSQENSWRKKTLTPFLMIRQVMFYLKFIRRVKAVFVMFGGYWALVPTLISRIFNKPCFIILGGTDCVSFPSLNYGNLRIHSLRLILKIAYQNATCLLPVHKSLIQSENNYYKKDENRQGLKNNFLDLNFNYKEIYNGFDSDVFKLTGTKRNKNRFVCIASIDDEIRFVLKGGDLIFQLAEIYQDCEFYIIGFGERFKKKSLQVPHNLFLVPFCDIDKLVTILNSSLFYLQLSISEGFPNALCEAMLCGCIAIGSNVGAIPEIINDDNRILFERDITQLKSIVDCLLSSSEYDLSKLSEESRLRVIQNYSVKKRQEKLFELLDKYEIK